MTVARLLYASLCSLLLLAAIPAANAAEMVSVARPEVNMRSGPGTNHEALWMLSQGYPLSVIGREGQWLKVRDFENDTGWVFRGVTGKTPYHIVKGQVVNIRKAPSTRAGIVGKTYYGELLRTLEKRASWVKIEHESGLVGWVSRKLLWGW
jgi:SH3-like domain-containing protein